MKQEKIPPDPLQGEVEKKYFRARDGNGLEIDINELIFPILKQVPDNNFYLIGTGFFITTNGIFITAKHVFQDVMDENGNPYCAIGMMQFMPNNNYIPRPIISCSVHNEADIGIGIVAQMTHNETKAPYSNKIVTLSGLRPIEGAHVTTYAYPKTVILRGKTQELYFYPSFYDGKIEEYYPEKRDNCMIKSPCFRTSIYIHGGASGGPVFDDEGRVFGVNCTGFEGTDISYVSRVIDVLNLTINNAIIPGENNPISVTIERLTKMGYVVFSPKIF
jgi:hypothetical protein